MFYNIKKNSVSTYPSPQVNCVVQCFLSEADMTDDNKAVYWIPFQVSLQECIGLTSEQIDAKIKTQGEALFNAPEMVTIFNAIEAGENIQTPKVI